MATKTCTYPDCTNPYYGKGYCAKHWARWRKHGDASVVKQGGPVPRERTEEFKRTGKATCIHHGEHTDWRVQAQKEKRGPRGERIYFALDCRKCERERTRRYVKENSDLVRTKMLTLHARASRACLSARRRAEKMGWDFDLTVEWIEQQHERQGGKCAYTGHEFDHTDMRKAPDSMSLDRVDPARGYTTDNVLLVGWRVNFAKLDMTLDEFRALCRDVVDTLG